MMTRDIKIWKSPLIMASLALFCLVLLIVGNLVTVIPSENTRTEYCLFNIVFGFAFLLTTAYAIRATREIK